MSDDKHPAEANDAGHIATTGEYEFGGEESRAFDGLARVMGWAGAGLVFLGLVQIVAGGLQLATHDEVSSAEISEAMIAIVVGFVMAMVGFWTRRAAGWFQMVADTRGADLTHLLNAIDDLSRLYRLQALTLAAAVVITAVSLAFFAVAVL